VYLECGGRLTGLNVQILSALGQHILSHGRLFVVGADFNVTVDEMEESDWARRLNACLVTGHLGYMAFSNGRLGRLIDYFMIDRRLADIGSTGKTTLEVPVSTI